MKSQTKTISFEAFSPETFAVAGISHRSTDLKVRGLLSLSEHQRRQLLDFGKRNRLGYLMVLSTCNRTEIYGDQRNLEFLMNRWQLLTTQEEVLVSENVGVKTGQDALNHLFTVISGADSQIPGDMQINHQVKTAFEESKKHGMTSGLFEQLINHAIRCGKRARTETGISSGVSSVPSAVSLIIKKAFSGQNMGNVVVLGAGKMGRLSCLNLLKHIEPSKIVLINRNEQKARGMASELRVRFAPFGELDSWLKIAEVVIVATGSSQPIVTDLHFVEENKKKVFDLSVPANVASEVKYLDHVKVYDLDELSSLATQHIGYRREELNDVHAIIDQSVEKFNEWYRRRQLYTQSKSIPGS